ncbi:MAG: ribosome maturation factor RimP [bacterium]|nr:ribosome maturation factor RimP [bacterium]
MDERTLQASIEQLSAAYLETQGAELVELQMSGNARRRMLRFYVDRPGGVTIDLCADLSRGIANVLDTHDPISGSYVLEVSSPGLNRALKSEKDFIRSVGKVVRLVVDGRDAIVGTLEDYSGACLLVKTDAEALRIPRDEVKKANLHFEF